MLHNRTMCRLAVFLCAFVASITAIAGAQSSSGPRQSFPCANVTMLTSGYLSALPQSSQNTVRMAVQPSIQAIVNNKVTGMEGTAIEVVPLRAIRITQGTTDSTLYVVSWDDRSFGVNGAIWIVELTPKGARNLTQLGHHQSHGYSLGCFGFEVLSPKAEVYPKIMIASSGFKDSGGAEAEDMCLRKSGNY